MNQPNDNDRITIWFNFLWHQWTVGFPNGKPLQFFDTLSEAIAYRADVENYYF